MGEDVRVIEGGGSGSIAGCPGRRRGEICNGSTKEGRECGVRGFYSESRA
jgi:hypothetical protein